MYHFKSITDPQQAIVGDGQILVQNIAGRTFRIGTPGFLVPPNGYAVVDAADPIIQHNLKHRRILAQQASGSANVAPEQAPESVDVAPDAPSKKAKKQKWSDVIAGEPEEVIAVEAPIMPEIEDVQSVSASFSEESVQVVDEIVAQSNADENIRSEEEELTPNSDSSSL